MDKITAIGCFAALAQPTRLKVFRLLVKAGQEGLAAGDIGIKLKIRQNTMSVHLGVLARTPLVRNRREGRSIRYYANYKGISALITYLMKDCCNGNQEICTPLLESLQCQPDDAQKPATSHQNETA